MGELHDEHFFIHNAIIPFQMPKNTNIQDVVQLIACNLTLKSIFYICTTKKERLMPETCLALVSVGTQFKICDSEMSTVLPRVFTMNLTEQREPSRARLSYAESRGKDWIQ